MVQYDLVSTMLDAQQVPYKVAGVPDSVSLREDWLIRTVPPGSIGKLCVLRDNSGIVIALYPADHDFNLRDLQNTLHRPLQLVESEQVLSKLNTTLLLSGSISRRNNNIKILIDEHLSDQDNIYFEANKPFTFYQVRTTDLETMVEDALIGSHFSKPVQTATTDPKPPASKPVKKSPILDKIMNMERLPELPEVTRAILNARNDSCSVDDFINILEADLVLSGQIVRYSNSAIFKNQPNVITLKDAIFRVLGYETVLHIALGYSLARNFRLPDIGGALGQATFWKHATYSAALSQQLASAMPEDIRPSIGLCYLSGLLHNIGFMVLNKLFRNESLWLNKMIIANPTIPITDIEHRLLGDTHCEWGAWLMRKWELPEELCTAVAEHHNPTYQGKHAVYVNLINLTDRLLKTHAMSDSVTDEIPDELLKRLGLEEEEVFLITDEVLQEANTLRDMAVAVSA